MAQLHCIVLAASCLFALSWAGHVAPRQANTPRPAFSVGLTHNENVTVSIDIVYDHVFIDTTNSYNSDTGVYTVPMTGEYVVMIHSLAEQNGTLSLDLQRNDNYIFSAYAHVTDQYGAASNVGVFHYDQGDRLHVVGKGSSILYGTDNEIYSTLSAYLLYDRSGPQ